MWPTETNLNPTDKDMTISAEKDTTQNSHEFGPSPLLDHALVTITVVEFSQYSYVVVLDDCTHPTYIVTGILDYCLSLEQGLNQAYKFLYEYDSTPARRPKVQTQLYMPRSNAGTLTTHANATLTNATTLTYARPERSTLRLTDYSWSRLLKLTQKPEHNYHGKGHGMGVGAFLCATFAANPTHEHWIDTRPTEGVSQWDAIRLRAGKLPYWLPEGSAHPRLKRPINAAHIIALSTTYNVPALAEHFGIMSRGGNNTAPSAKISAFVEAYGFGYITPIQPTPPNPKPVNPKRREYRANRAKVHGAPGQGITW